MPKGIFTHGVQNVDSWLQDKAGREAALQSLTASNVTDYLAEDGRTTLQSASKLPTSTR
jgi:hypothetical protein